MQKTYAYLFKKHCKILQLEIFHQQLSCMKFYLFTATRRRKEHALAHTPAEISEESNLLFVYGSLMRGMERASFMNSADKASFAGAASTRGTLYDLGAFPGMREGNNGSLVHGELYELIDPETFFATLDLIEGYWPEQPERSLYVRKLVSVSTNAGEKSAWIYFLNQPLAGLKVIPSGDYRQCTHEVELEELE